MLGTPRVPCLVTGFVAFGITVPFPYLYNYSDLSPGHSRKPKCQQQMPPQGLQAESPSSSIPRGSLPNVTCQMLRETVLEFLAFKMLVMILLSNTHCRRQDSPLFSAKVKFHQSNFPVLMSQISSRQPPATDQEQELVDAHLGFALFAVVGNSPGHGPGRVETQF